MALTRQKTENCVELPDHLKISRHDEVTERFYRSYEMGPDCKYQECEDRAEFGIVDLRTGEVVPVCSVHLMTLGSIAKQTPDMPPPGQRINGPWFPA